MDKSPSSEPSAPKSKSPLFPIRTGQAKAPWLWVVLMYANWGSYQYVELLSTTGITFVLRPLVDSPIWITAIASLNTVFNVFVGSSMNYRSDRTWTRWGRRRPYVIVGQFVIIFGVLIIPEVKTLAALVATLFCYELLRDVQQPIEPLINEVTPPKQRGRGMAVSKIAKQLSTMFFFGVMVANYDNSFDLPFGMKVTGDRALFWVGCAFALYTLCVVTFLVKETPPVTTPPISRKGNVFSGIKTACLEIFGNRQWLSLYLLGIAMMIFWLGLGALKPLLYIEQFGFAKSDFGYLMAIVIPLQLAVMPAGGWLTDRFSRITIFKIGGLLTVALHVIFFSYAKFFAPQGMPSFSFLVAMEFVTQAVGGIAAMAASALIFDYVPAKNLGTVCSGIGAVRGISAVLINNGVGVWTAVASKLYMPEGTFDYLSAYLYLIILAIGGTWVGFWFDRRTREGKLIPYGRMEADLLAKHLG